MATLKSQIIANSTHHTYQLNKTRIATLRKNELVTSEMGIILDMLNFAAWMDTNVMALQTIRTITSTSYDRETAVVIAVNLWDSLGSELDYTYGGRENGAVSSSYDTYQAYIENCRSSVYFI